MTLAGNQHHQPTSTTHHTSPRPQILSATDSHSPIAPSVTHPILNALPPSSATRPAVTASASASAPAPASAPTPTPAVASASASAPASEPPPRPAVTASASTAHASGPQEPASSLLHSRSVATGTNLSPRPRRSSRYTPRKRLASLMLDLGKATSEPAADSAAAGPAIDSDGDIHQQAAPLPNDPVDHLPLDHPDGPDAPDPRDTHAHVHAHRHHHHHHLAPLVGLDERYRRALSTTRNAHSDTPPLPAQDDEIATAQRLFDVTLESPSSPGAAYKRMRSSADSDAGSSSCKDMEDPEVLAPDSVPAFVSQIHQMLDYVKSKPSLQHGSASFMRDYLRTLLMQNAVAADEAIQAANKTHKADVMAGRRKADELFKRIPDDLAKHIFGFLDGKDLSRVREVCTRWNEFACEEHLWKALCLKRWRSLESDTEVWKLIDPNVDVGGPQRWRHIYPKVSRGSQWNCRLQKTGRFICNLVAHHIAGAPLGDAGLPKVLVVERRFNILHLHTFVLPDASVLYFEPQAESDRAGFDDFIDYLHKRTRAGLALEDQRRFIFIPPCEYTRTQVNYQGRSLLGVVQNAYPPLAP